MKCRLQHLYLDDNKDLGMFLGCVLWEVTDWHFMFNSFDNIKISCFLAFTPCVEPNRVLRSSAACRKCKSQHLPVSSIFCSINATWKWTSALLCIFLQSAPSEKIYSEKALWAPCWRSCHQNNAVYTSLPINQILIWSVCCLLFRKTDDALSYYIVS